MPSVWQSRRAACVVRKEAQQDGLARVAVRTVTRRGLRSPERPPRNISGVQVNERGSAGVRCRTAAHRSDTRASHTSRHRSISTGPSTANSKSRRATTSPSHSAFMSARSPWLTTCSTTGASSVVVADDLVEPRPPHVRQTQRSAGTAIGCRRRVVSCCRYEARVRSDEADGATGVASCTTRRAPTAGGSLVAAPWVSAWATPRAGSGLEPPRSRSSHDPRSCPPRGSSGVRPRAAERAPSATSAAMPSTTDVFAIRTARPTTDPGRVRVLPRARRIPLRSPPCCGRRLGGQGPDDGSLRRVAVLVEPVRLRLGLLHRWGRPVVSTPSLRYCATYPVAACRGKKGYDDRIRVSARVRARTVSNATISPSCQCTSPFLASPSRSQSGR